MLKIGMNVTVKIFDCGLDPRSKSVKKLSIRGTLF